MDITISKYGYRYFVLVISKLRISNIYTWADLMISII